MAGLFEKIKRDIRKGIKEGLAVVREKANTVSEKMGELTTEGKRQYKVFSLKYKIQSQMTELGGRTYDILDSKQNVDVDGKTKAIAAKIKKLENQLSKLEAAKETKAAARKKSVKKEKTKTKAKKPVPTVAKKMVKKTVVKKNKKASASK